MKLLWLLSCTVDWNETQMWGRRVQSQIILCRVALPDWRLGGCSLLAGTLQIIRPVAVGC